MDPVPLLVTRPASEIPALQEALRGRRIVVAAPCLEFEPLPLNHAFFETYRGRRLDILVTSPRAVPSLSELLLDPQWRVLALAPSTSRLLKSLEIRVDREVEGGAAVLVRLAEDPMVLLGSDLAGEEVWKQRPEAKRLVVYRTCCPASLPESAVQAMNEPFDLLFFSPSAVQFFQQLAPGRLADARQVWASGRTTGQALETCHQPYQFWNQT